MASKYFKAFQFAKKVGPTIQGVAPKIAKTTGDKIKRTVSQIKRMTTAKTKKLSDDMQMKSKEIKDTLDKMRTPKALGGILDPLKKRDKKKEKEDSKKGTKPKDLIYKPKKMKRLEELRKELKQEGGPVGRGLQGAKPQYITKKEKPKYITKKEKPQYITKKSKYITKKKKPVQSEPKYITRKEKPKYITRREKTPAKAGPRTLGGGPRD